MPSDHWKRLARQWNALGPPLRPSAPDVAVVQQLIDRELAPASARATAMILGVTPELATLHWPDSVRVIAADRGLDMIRSIWPAAAVAPSSRAVNALWTDLPVRAGVIDFLCGDGCNPSLTFPDESRQWMHAIHRALRRGGLLVLRLFLRPEPAVSPASLVAAAMRREIESFHGFKIRLAMSLQRDPAEGVRLGDVWDAWSGLVPDRASFAHASGWAAETIATIDNYREAQASYAFASLEEWRGMVPPALEEIECLIPAYEEGASFPTLVYRAI